MLAIIGWAMDYREQAEELYHILANKNNSKIPKLFDDGLRGIYPILRILRDSGSEILPGDIARIMDISTARVAVAIKTLEKKGYISRIPASYDGRKIILKITPSGLQALSERETYIYEFTETFLRKVSIDEAQTFIETARKIFS